MLQNDRHIVLTHQTTYSYSGIGSSERPLNLFIHHGKHVTFLSVLEMVTDCLCLYYYGWWTFPEIGCYLKVSGTPYVGSKKSKKKKAEGDTISPRGIKEIGSFKHSTFLTGTGNRK